MAYMAAKNQATSFLKYDPSEWLPPMRLQLTSLNSFVMIPLGLLTALTFVLTLFAGVGEGPPPAWLNLPTFAHVVLGGALSFLMVFRTNTAYSRWWEARLMWGQVAVTSRSMAAQSISMLTPPARRLLVHQLIAFAVSMKNSLRGTPIRASELVGEGEELARALNDAASPPCAAVEVLARTIRTGLRSDDGASPALGAALAAQAYAQLNTGLGALTQAATACERVKSTPLPLGYVAALRFFLALWLVTLPCVVVGAYGMMATPVVSLIAFLFLNLEAMALEIEQPFGYDANDLPLEEYCAAIERVLLDMTRRQERQEQDQEK